MLNILKYTTPIRQITKQPLLYMPSSCFSLVKGDMKSYIPLQTVLVAQW